jgi:hypothetical protein
MPTNTIILPIDNPIYNINSGSYLDILGPFEPARIDGGSPSRPLLFATNSSQAVAYRYRMPQDYSSSPVAVMQYSMASANSGEIIDPQFYVMAVSSGSGNPNTPSFDTVNKTNSGQTIPGSNGSIDDLSIALTNDDGLAARDYFVLAMVRAHDGNDTAAGDMKLHTLSLEYTTT